MLSIGALTDRMVRQAIKVHGRSLLLAVWRSPSGCKRSCHASWGLMAPCCDHNGVLHAPRPADGSAGVAVGYGEFWPLFWQFSTDGALRLLLPALIVAFGAESTEAFAFSIVVTATVGLLGGQLALSRTHAFSINRHVSTGIDVRALAALLVAGVGIQLLANGAPPVLSLINRDPAIVPRWRRRCAGAHAYHSSLPPRSNTLCFRR